MADVGNDVFSTLRYLNRFDPAVSTKEDVRVELSRALSEWAAANNPFLV
jgi:hypothetical protein